jgi:hypothetical protein
MDELEHILANLEYLPTSNLISELDTNFSQELLNEIKYRINYNKRLATLANIDYIRRINSKETIIENGS